jgi:hypothetical protein
MSATFDILDNIQCDDDVVVGDDYPEPEGPRPALPGRYLVTVEKWGWKTKKDGTPVIQTDENGNMYPVLQIQAVKILEPTDSQRTVYIYQDFATKPFKRGNQMVSRATDLLHAIDPTVAVAGTKAVISELQVALNGVHSFGVRLDWSAYDSAYPDAEFEKAGGRDTMEKADINKVYNTARIRGWKRIQKDNVKRGGNPRPSHVWIGPSGMSFEARPEVTAFLSKDEDISGPDREFVQ